MQEDCWIVSTDFDSDDSKVQDIDSSNDPSGDKNYTHQKAFKWAAY